MTKTQAIVAIKALPGMTAKATGFDNEIRVTRTDVSPKKAEDMAHYTDDPDDAFGTAKWMSERPPRGNPNIQGPCGATLATGGATCSEPTSNPASIPEYWDWLSRSGRRDLIAAFVDNQLQLDRVPGLKWGRLSGAEQQLVTDAYESTMQQVNRPRPNGLFGFGRTPGTAAEEVAKTLRDRAKSNGATGLKVETLSKHEIVVTCKKLWTGALDISINKSAGASYSLSFNWNKSVVTIENDSLLLMVGDFFELLT